MRACLAVNNKQNVSSPSPPFRAESATSSATLVPEAASADRFFESVQLCRAVAAWMVFLFHVGIILAKPKYFGWDGLAHAFSFGRAGVEFFFVLSGFIIFHAHAEDLGKPARWAHYMLRRILRIYPLYWLVFLVTLAISLLALPMSNLAAAPAEALLSSLLLLPMDPVMVQSRGAPVVPVAWTLHYELMFYAAFGIAILVRRAGLVLIALFIAGWTYSLASGARPFPLNFFLADYFWLFIAGCAVAWLVRRVRIPLLGARVLTLAGAASLFAVASALGPGQYIDQTSMVLLLGAASALLLFGAVQWELGSEDFRVPRLALQLGAASYALYLIHFPLITLCCKLVAALGWLAWGAPAMLLVALLSALLSGGLAVLLHRFFEKPVQGLARQGARGT